MTDILKLGAASFHPSNALTGNEDMTVYRGQNMMLRGEPGSYYFEAFAGIKNLQEPIPSVVMAGTLSFTAGDNRIEGTDTLFKDELHIGQFIYAGTDVLVVEEIISDTLFLCDRPPYKSGVNKPGYKMPVLFEIDNKRGTLIWGNALKFDLGNIVCVGEGNLRLNGEMLPGTSLVADRKVKLAIFDENTGNYSVERFGFRVDPRAEDLRIDVVPGGTKQMTLGNYSFRFAWANKETAFGFSNPSDVIKIDGSGNSLAITASGQRFRLDFTGALAHKPTNADAIIVYRSMFSTGARSNLTSYAEGSWFVASTVLIADLLPGDLLYVDVLDAELGTEVTFDNDPPPDADWVTALAGDIVLLSCHGEKTVANPDGTSPGPMIVPQRRGNRDAFPAETSTPLSPPDTIIGFAASVGRIFLMTRVGLPFATSTGQADFPITTRPFWQTGFKGPFGLAFINDTLYAFTSKGVTRSIATGDEGADQYAFAAAAEDITRGWYAGHVHAVHDPANELACFIYSASHRNAEGYWVSTVLPFNLRQQAFMPLIIIEKPGRDMVVCGAAKINGHLQFLAGGSGIPEVLPVSEEPPISVESGSIEEEDPGEVFAPLTGTVFVCGAECIAEISSANAHMSTDTTAVIRTDERVRSGGYSWKVTGHVRGRFGLPMRPRGQSGDPAGDPQTAPVPPAVDEYSDVWVGRIFVNFAELPVDDAYILLSGTGSGDLALDIVGTMGIVVGIDQKFYIGGDFGAWWVTYPVMRRGTGIPFLMDRWYRIDFKIDRVNARVDLIVKDDATDTILGNVYHQFAGTTHPRDAIRFGPYGGDGGITYYDDIVITNDAANWPIGESYIVGMRAVSDGTHTIPANMTINVDGVGPLMPPAEGWSHLGEYVEGSGFTRTPSIALRYAAGGSGETILRFNLDVVSGVASVIRGPRAVAIQVGNYHGNGYGVAILNDNGTLAVINDFPFFNNHDEIRNHWVPTPPSNPTGEWQVTGGDGNIHNLELQMRTTSGWTTIHSFALEMEFFGREGID